MKQIMVVVLIFTTLNVNSQYKRQKNNLSDNLSIQIKAGPSMVVTEYKRDFSGIIKEMHHLPGPGVSVGLSKLINPWLEIGYELEYSSFNGFQDHPDFSAYDFGHYRISLMNLEPVIYQSTIRSHNAVVVFHADPREKKRWVPFAYIKGGYSRIFSTLKYKENKEVIFSKTGREETDPNSSIFVDNFNLGIGFGNEFILNKNTSLNVHYDINLVNDDNLDAVHNFREPPPEGYKNFISGIYTRIQMSVSYNLNPDRKRIAVRKYLIRDASHKSHKKKIVASWYKKRRK